MKASVSKRLCFQKHTKPGFSSRWSRGGGQCHMRGAHWPWVCLVQWVEGGSSRGSFLGTGTCVSVGLRADWARQAIVWLLLTLGWFFSLRHRGCLACLRSHSQQLWQGGGKKTSEDAEGPGGVLQQFLSVQGESEEVKPNKTPSQLIRAGHLVGVCHAPPPTSCPWPSVSHPGLTWPPRRGVLEEVWPMVCQPHPALPTHSGLLLHRGAPGWPDLSTRHISMGVLTPDPAQGAQHWSFSSLVSVAPSSTTYFSIHPQQGCVEHTM